MTKKSKTKNKIKSGKAGSGFAGKSTGKRTGLRKNYESHYLAIILVTFLLLEGFLGTTTKLEDWQRGIAILDVSSSVADTASNLATVFQPMTDTIDGVNQFYALAATEMTQLLDLSGDETFAEIDLIYDGVYDFYQQASMQMASVLDVSSFNSWSARVAGASVSTR